MRESTPPFALSSNRGGHSRLAWWTLACALVVGAIARSVWIGDMEWKHDERWSYQMSQQVGRSRPWPAVGMPTSLGFPNPGLSVWIFVPIGRITGTPTSMARAIVFLNMLGLVGFAWAVRAYLPPEEREPWIWGLALQAASPFAIRLSRKIWPPSILTPLLLLLWIAHRHRLSRWGAFGWGLMGALIGQIHLSGWFVAAGLAIGTAVAEWRGNLARSRYWHWWLLGTLAGLLSALPWAMSLARTSDSLPMGSVSRIIMQHIPGYLYGFVATLTSLIPFAPLGLGYDTARYLVGPVIGGVRMHFADVLSWCIFLAIIVRILARLWAAVVLPGWRWGLRKLARALGRRPSENADRPASGPPAVAGAPQPSTRFYLWSTVAIPSALFVLTTDVYFYHYYFVMCPFLFVLGAVCLLTWRRVLVGVVIAQALLSCCFLTYIHENGGTHRGEYGASYARQGYR